MLDAHVFVEDKAAHVLHHYGLGTCATAGTVCIVQLRENRSSLIQGLLSRRRCSAVSISPATEATSDVAEAAWNKIMLISHEAAVWLYDVLADRLWLYAALCGDGNAQACGDARTKIEAQLPPDAWLGRLLGRQGRAKPSELTAAG
jgi:hypothetical protein